MSETYDELLQKRREQESRAQVDNLDMFRDFADRGQKAQAAVDAIIPPARARRTDVETSHEAAARVDQAAQHAAILNALTAYGPMTADRVDELLGWRSATASRRLPELVVMGKVERLEKEYAKPTRTGRMARVYRVVS